MTPKVVIAQTNKWVCGNTWCGNAQKSSWRNEKHPVNIYEGLHVHPDTVVDLAGTF